MATIPPAEDGISVGESDRPVLRQLVQAIQGAHSADISINGAEPTPLPPLARQALVQVMKAMLEGDFVHIDALDSILTTQQAADFIGISRPSLIKLLGNEPNQIPYVKPAPGHSHRRVRLTDLVEFRDRLAAEATERGRPKLDKLREAFLAEARRVSETNSGPQSPSGASYGQTHKLATTINGRKRQDQVEPRLLLVHYLRDMVGLTGTHIGCDTSQCGACTILVDGMAVKSCTMFAVQAEARNITTIEGMAKDGQLHPLQQAFWDEHGLQCGYCTPGFIMAAAYLLEQNPDPTEREIRVGLEGNLCRCTGYVNIIKAVQSAAKAMHASAARRPSAVLYGN